MEHRSQIQLTSWIHQMVMNDKFHAIQNLKNDTTKLNLASVLQQILLDENLTFLRVQKLTNKYADPDAKIYYSIISINHLKIIISLPNL